VSDVLRLTVFRRHPEAGTVVLRAFLAFVLVYGTQDNVRSAERMLEFRDFLARNSFPWPLASAYVSVYAQLTCGVLFLLGAFTRHAALVMVVNFLVALAMVHVRLPWEANIAPLAMLFGSIFLLFHGPGPWSIDERRQARDGSVAFQLRERKEGA
jgi:putative oxidoreductase